MRVVARFLDDDAEGFKAAFVDIASRFEMDWSLRPASQRRKVVALVSTFDHCLGHLLYARRIGEHDMDVVAILSNHPQEELTITTWQIGRTSGRARVGPEGACLVVAGTL